MAISPPSAILNSSNVVATVFTASGGSGTYTWTLVNTALGSISTANATATYNNLAVIGTNALTVTDSNSNSASATITQVPGGAGIPVP